MFDMFEIYNVSQKCYRNKIVRDTKTAGLITIAIHNKQATSSKIKKRVGDYAALH